MNDSEKYLYKIFVTVSKFQHSNSTSNVSIQLFGKSSFGLRSFKFPLAKSKNRIKPFQSGQTYLFEIEEAFIGSLKKIILTNQDSQTSGLHIKNVKIEIPDLNKSWNFFCNQWLKHELALSQEKTEEESSTQRDQWFGNARYTIRILTSECTKLNFDPMINLKIIGKTNETKLIRLNSTPSDNEKPKFKSGNIDIFRLEEADVESIEKLVFFCENDENGKQIEWFYDSITVDMPSKLSRYLFTRNSRTIIKNSKKETMIEIHPINVKKISDEKKEKSYCINLYLSDIKYRSDFIQSMKIVLYGDYSISRQIKPFELKSIGCCDTMNDQLIHFHHKQADMGQIYKAKIIFSIEKEKKKLFKKLKWFLNMIEIDYRKEKFIFEYKKWIDFKKYDLNKSLEFKLYEKNFSKEQKRTISTLSHRLLEESIQNDSYDESFDEIDEKEKRRSPSPRQKKSSRTESTSSSPRKADKADLKSKLRFEQDLEELASSDSTLSTVSSNSFKSSSRKSFKSPSKLGNKSKWSDDEDFRPKRSPSPNSWKFSSKKEKKKSELSSDDDGIRTKNSPLSTLSKSANKANKTEWSSDDDDITYEDSRKLKLNEKAKWNKDHPKSGKFSEKLEKLSNRESLFEKEIDKENLRTRHKESKPSIIDEDYDQFLDSPIPKFSSSLMNRFKQKEPREQSFIKESLRDFDKRNYTSNDFKSDNRYVSRF